MPAYCEKDGLHWFPSLLRVQIFFSLPFYEKQFQDIPGHDGHRLRLILLFFHLIKIPDLDSIQLYGNRHSALPAQLILFPYIKKRLNHNNPDVLHPRYPGGSLLPLNDAHKCRLLLLQSLPRQVSESFLNFLLLIHKPPAVRLLLQPRHQSLPAIHFHLLFWLKNKFHLIQNVPKEAFLTIHYDKSRLRYTNGCLESEK